jgi:hypothetical protein
MHKKSAITTSWYWDCFCVELDFDYKPTDDIVLAWYLHIFFSILLLVCPSYQCDNFIEDKFVVEMSALSENKVTFAHFLEGIYSCTN